MNLTKIEQMRLAKYQQYFGILKSDEALLLAIDDDNTARYCGPFDPTTSRLLTNSRMLLDYAELLEKQENGQ